MWSESHPRLDSRSCTLLRDASHRLGNHAVFQHAPCFPPYNVVHSGPSRMYNVVPRASVCMMGQSEALGRPMWGLRQWKNLQADQMVVTIRAHMATAPATESA